MEKSDRRIRILRELDDHDLFLRTGDLFGHYLRKVARNKLAADGMVEANRAIVQDLVSDTVGDCFPYIKDPIRAGEFENDKALGGYLARALNRKIARHIHKENCRRAREADLHTSAKHIAHSPDEQHDELLDCQLVAARAASTLPLNKLLLYNYDRFGGPFFDQFCFGDLAFHEYIGITKGNAAVLRHRTQTEVERAVASHDYPDRVPSLLRRGVSDIDFSSMINSGLAQDIPGLESIGAKGSPIERIVALAVHELCLERIPAEVQSWEELLAPLGGAYLAAILFKILFEPRWAAVAQYIFTRHAAHIVNNYSIPALNREYLLETFPLLIGSVSDLYRVVEPLPAVKHEWYETGKDDEVVLIKMVLDHHHLDNLPFNDDSNPFWKALLRGPEL